MKPTPGPGDPESLQEKMTSELGPNAGAEVRQVDKGEGASKQREQHAVVLQQGDFDWWVLLEARNDG